MAYGKYNGSSSRRRGTYRRRGRGRRYTRRATTSSSTNWGQLARKAYSTAKFVASIVNAEKKFYDTNVALTNIDNLGFQIFALSLMVQGDDENQRNGRSIKGQSLVVRLLAQLQSAADSSLFRVVIIRDKAASTSIAPTASDIFQTTSSNIAPISPRNLLTGAAERYDIVWDKCYQMDTNNNTIQKVMKNIPLNSHIHYTGTSNTAADAGNGNLYVMFVSTGTSASNTGTTVSGTIRLRFYDN